jgi:hypothetical protein
MRRSTQDISRWSCLAIYLLAVLALSLGSAGVVNADPFEPALLHHEQSRVTGNGDPLPLGIFELDGNATTGVLGTSGSTTTSHDWDQVFADVLNGTNTAGALAHCFLSDAVNTSSDFGFKGSGSKDTMGIQQGPWLYTDVKQQGRADIAHAFAAGYTDPSTGDLILSFGADRFDSGGAFMGFWFLRGAVTQSAATPAPAGSRFVGTHVDGDILIVCDASTGGSLSVYRWNGDDATGSLVALQVPPGVNSSAFVIVNSGPISVPWSFTDKSGAHQPAAGEFIEGAINLTGIEVTTPGASFPFSAFLAETRSSASPAASLLDYVFGTF